MGFFMITRLKHSKKNYKLNNFQPGANYVHACKIPDAVMRKTHANKNSPALKKELAIIFHSHSTCYLCVCVRRIRC